MAAAFPRRDEINGYRVPLMNGGNTVTSRWHDPAFDHQRSALGRDLNQRMALEDIADLREADMVAVFSSPGQSRGGMHFETGLAYGLGKIVVLIGPTENVFHDLIAIRFTEPSAFIKWMDKCMHVTIAS